MNYNTRDKFMQSIIVASQNREKAKEYIDKISKTQKVEPIDVTINSFEKTVGIEDVRDLQKKIFLKPLRSKIKISVIEAFEGITTESQNALLKILEEPPNNTIIIIAVGNIGIILPTILSRCKIIDLKQEIKTLSKQELLSIKDILVYLQSKEIGRKLKLAQDLTKNKEEIIPWLEKMIIVAREKLIDSVCHSEPFDPAQGKLREETHEILRLKPQDDITIVSHYLNILVSFQKTHTILKTTNVNPRLALENLFLSL